MNGVGFEILARTPYQNYPQVTPTPKGGIVRWGQILTNFINPEYTLVSLRHLPISLMN